MRVVCLSDTHGLHDEVTVPDGDLLLHSGDVCNHGTKGEFKRFIAWLGELPHPQKVFIAGNHDRVLEKHRRYVRHWVKHGTYLFDQSVVVNGLKIYGSPWQPSYHNWAFNLDRGRHMAAVWEKIPEDTDILLTHTPPAGILDDGIGCADLTERLAKLNLRLHLFGHSHVGYGTKRVGSTTFVNAAICDPDYRPSRSPIILDL